MLLKKVLYGHTRIRSVQIYSENGQVCFMFHRWRPLGPQTNGWISRQYSCREYRRKNSQRYVQNIRSKIEKSHIVIYSAENWMLTLYTETISHAIFRNILDSVWLWLFVYFMLKYWMK